MKQILLFLIVICLAVGIKAQTLDSIYRADLTLAGSIRVLDSTALLTRGIMPVQGVLDSMAWMGHNRDGIDDTVMVIVYSNSANLPTTWLDSGLARTVVNWSSAQRQAQTLCIRPTKNAGDTIWFGVFLINRSTNGETSVSHAGAAPTGYRHAYSATTDPKPPSTITCLGYDAGASNLPQMVLYYHTLTGSTGTLDIVGGVYGG